jgi:MFS family permease
VYGYFSLLPVVVGQTMGTDTTSQGLAMAVGGVGVAVGALTMGPIARRIGVGRLLIAAILGATVGLATLAMGQTAIVVLLAATLIPTFTNVQAASANVALQTLAPPAMRGRVVGMYSMVFSALLPVGTVTAGWLGTRVGVRETLLGLAATMAIIAILIHRRRPTLAQDLRPADAEPGPHGESAAEPGVLTEPIRAES